MGFLYPATLMFTILYWFIYICVFTLMLISLWKIYVKMGAPGWKGIVPFYNTWVMIDLLRKPRHWFWIILGCIVGILVSVFSMTFAVILDPNDISALLLPLFFLLLFTVIGVVYEVKVFIALSKSFGYDPLFVIVLFLIPVVFYAMIAFGDHRFTPPQPKPQVAPGGPVVLEEEFLLKDIPDRPDDLPEEK